MLRIFSSRHSVLPLVLISAIACSHAMLGAQNFRVIPVANSATEGSTSAIYPFGYAYSRSQQIWLGSSVATNTALIKSVNFRRDTSSRTTRAALSGRKFTKVKLSLGSTTVAPLNMSTSFAANLASSMTTVFTGNIVLPNQPAVKLAGAAPFNVKMPTSRPYLFNGASGHLVYDMVFPGSVGLTNYFLDAELTTLGSHGTTTSYGTSGNFKKPESFTLTADTRLLAPGGVFNIKCGSFSRAYPGMLVLGVSKKTWGSTPLPLSLKFMGAAGNFLYASPDFLVPFSAVKSGIGYQSQLKIIVPSLASYRSVSLHTQAYYTDAAANAAGIVTTRGLTVKLSSTFAGPVTNQIGSSNSQSKTGVYPYRTGLGTLRFGGPVVQFEGVIR